MLLVYYNIRRSAFRTVSPLNLFSLIITIHSLKQAARFELVPSDWKSDMLPITPRLHPGRFATHRSRAPKTCGRYAVTTCRATPPALPICFGNSAMECTRLELVIFGLQSRCATIAPAPLTCSRCGVTCVFGLWPLQPRRLLYTIRLPCLLASGIVILSEVLRMLSDHPGATRLLALGVRLELNISGLKGHRADLCTTQAHGAIGRACTCILRSCARSTTHIHLCTNV